MDENGRWVTMNGAHVFIKDINVDLLTESIYKKEDFKYLTNEELRQLRSDISEKINWLFTSEYYDSKKIKTLTANEKKISQLIISNSIK